MNNGTFGCWRPRNTCTILGIWTITGLITNEKPRAPACHIPCIDIWGPWSHDSWRQTIVESMYDTGSPRHQEGGIKGGKKRDELSSSGVGRPSVTISLAMLFRFWKKVIFHAIVVNKQSDVDLKKEITLFSPSFLQSSSINSARMTEDGWRRKKTQLRTDFLRPAVNLQPTFQF